MTTHDILFNGFKNHIGPTDAITSNEIITELKKNNFILTEGQIRDEVSRMRENNPFGNRFLVSSSEGYYLTSDVAEIERWLESYASKVMSMIPVIRGAMQYISPKLQEELKQKFTLM